MLLILGGVTLAALAQSAGANWSTGSDPVPPMLPPATPAETTATIDSIQSELTPEQKLGAFLAAIRHFESGDDYGILYGGGHFTDFSRHPRIAIPIHLPGYEGKFSTAAGAYQINWPTYQDFAPKAGITGFSPAEQDTIAYAILHRIGALDAIIEGKIDQAFRLASKRWASLPYSTAGQNPQTIAAANDWYLDWLRQNT